MSSEAVNDQPRYAAQNVADVHANSYFWSKYLDWQSEIPHVRNNWICYDFRELRIIPTAYAIRSCCDGMVGPTNLKSWVVEISINGNDWRQIDYKENNSELNDVNVCKTFAVSAADVCRFVKLTNIGRNYFGDDSICISSFEIFGHLVEVNRYVREKRFLSAYTPLNGIIAHLTKECCGNVHDREVVTVTSSEVLQKKACYAAKNVADLSLNSVFCSAHRNLLILHSRNNWICCNFKNRRVIPTHYAIRSECQAMDKGKHLKSWVVESSMDGSEWTEIDHKEDNSALNAPHALQVFPVANGGVCKLIKLVNIGKNHGGNDALCMSSFEIFGCLIEDVD
jgi:hypothetical protein